MARGKARRSASGSNFYELVVDLAQKKSTTVFYRYLEHTYKLRLWMQFMLLLDKGWGEKQVRVGQKERTDHEICLLRRDLPVILPVRSNADLRPLIVCTISSVQCVAQSVRKKCDRDRWLE
jgi:hypothetical protein